MGRQGSEQAQQARPGKNLLDRVLLLPQEVLQKEFVTL